MSIESQEYQEDIAVLSDLIRDLVPFVYRAAYPSKSPHKQDAIDAGRMLERLKEAGFYG